MKKPNHFYIYLITNLISKKQYIGSRQCYLDDPFADKYMDSSKYLKDDFKIYGKENFVKEIIDISCKDKIDMLNKETFYILQYGTLFPNGYNRFLPNSKNGFHTGGESLSIDHKNKISAACKGRKNPMFGKRRSKEFSLRIIESNKNRIVSEETRKKMSISKTISSDGENNAMHGKHHSIKTIDQISKSNIGKHQFTHSIEAKQKMKDAWAKRKALINT